MTVFLIAVLLLTIGALSLFIFPILPFRREKNSLVFAKRGYIVFVFMLFAVLVPVMYTHFGAPVMHDYPLVVRDTLEAEKAPADMAHVRRLERYLEAHPDDGAVWEQLGAAYRDAALYDQAVTAFRNAIEWGIPEDITNWHALAETLIRAHNGRILGEAQKACATVPTTPKPFIFWDWRACKTKSRKRHWHFGGTWNRFYPRKTRGWALFKNASGNWGGMQKSIPLRSNRKTPSPSRVKCRAQPATAG